MHSVVQINWVRILERDKERTRLRDDFVSSELFFKKIITHHTRQHRDIIQFFFFFIPTMIRRNIFKWATSKSDIYLDSKMKQGHSLPRCLKLDNDECNSGSRLVFNPYWQIKKTGFLHKWGNNTLTIPSTRTACASWSQWIQKISKMSTV